MFLAEEIPRLSELVRDKSFSNKRDREERTRTHANDPPQNTPVTPASSVTERVGAPKEKRVAFREPVPLSNLSPKSAHGDKGKGKLVDTPPPKKLKSTAVPGPKQMVPHQTTPSRPEADFSHHLSLDEQAGSRVCATAHEAMTKMANSLNIVNGEVWDRFNNEDVPSLLELGIRTQSVVSLISVELFVRM